MLTRYIIERRSWICLFIFFQILLIFMAYLDLKISLDSIIYIVFLSIIIFSSFFFVRYRRETRFYLSLEEYDYEQEITNIVEPNSPFQKIIKNSLMEQAEGLNQKVLRNQMFIEQEKDELLAWIHEIKTPLTAMSLMLERIDNESLKAHLKYEWLRIHFLLDQQLHQKRLVFIENDLYIEQVDLNAIIINEIKTLQSWCIQKGIGFDLNLEIPYVLSDAKWLAFIIRQLLTNAVKYSELSDIIVESYQQNGQTMLDVKDFGRGIAAKDVNRIFDKGFTSTTNHVDAVSTGMGLYLTKKICSTLLIQIKVDSKPDRGTTFTLLFPKKNDLLNIASM